MGLSYHDLELARFSSEPAVAVGVSGGPDSMALAFLLQGWTQAHGIALHILTVDHGLRPESRDEAAQVAAWVKDWPNATHHILFWEGDKPESRLLEEARRARYRLMRDYCAAHHIRYLFLAHHQDDQAETFLLRLAKGSGVDGLAAMQALQPLDGVTLVRPLLFYAKEDLLALCAAQSLAYVRDPSNENTRYLRPRLRAARAALEEEGLSSKRLAVTAMRIGRARAALEAIAAQAFAAHLNQEKDKALGFDADALRMLPLEIVLRVVLMAMHRVRAGEHDYPPRLEKVEHLIEDMVRDGLSVTTSLGGCLFVPDRKNGLLWVKTEGA